MCVSVILGFGAVKAKPGGLEVQVVDYRVRKTTAMRLSFKEKKKGIQTHREEINNACIWMRRSFMVKPNVKREEILP